MANRKTPEEQLQELEKKLTQLQNQKKALMARQKEEERKARTRRLINIGAAVEHFAGEITDFEAFNRYLAQYGSAIASMQKKAQMEAVPKKEEPGNGAEENG